MIHIASFILGVTIILVWIFVNSLNIRKLERTINALNTKLNASETNTHDKFDLVNHNIKEIRLTEIPQVKYELNELSKKLEKPAKKTTTKKASKPKETIKNKSKKEG